MPGRQINNPSASPGKYLIRLMWCFLNNRETGTLDRYVTLGPEVPGHCPEYLKLTLIVHLFKNAILFIVPKFRNPRPLFSLPLLPPSPCIKLAADSFCNSGGNLTPHRDVYYFMSKSKHCVKCFFLSTICGSLELQNVDFRESQSFQRQS